MKFTVSNSILTENLSLAIRAVPDRPTHPILANILVIADKQQQTVQITGFDLALGIVVRFNADVEQGGEITVPAKLFSEITSKLKGEISFEVSDGDYGLISQGKSQYKIRVQARDEYPELPTVEDGRQLKLNSSTFAEGLKHTLFAVSPDETKQILTGINMEFGGEAITFASTDGHRLSTFEVPRYDKENTLPIEVESEKVVLTINANSCRELLKVLEKSNNGDILDLTFNDNNIAARCGENLIITRKIEGQYPNWRQLLPKSFSKSVKVNRKDLIAALQRLHLLAGKNDMAKCSFEENQIYLRADTADVGTGTEYLPATIETNEDSFKFAFNIKYFLHGLKEMDSEFVAIKLNEALKPIIIEPIGEQKMQYLVMPVQARS